MGTRSLGAVFLELWAEKELCRGVAGKGEGWVTVFLKIEDLNRTAWPFQS